MSSSFLATGIFATEPGQRFLYILLRIGDRGFRALFEKCNGETDNRYYQEGLKRCSGWSDEVFNEDYEFVCESCPDLEETYRSTFTKYTVDRFGTLKDIRYPSFHLFLKRFLVSLSEHECMKSGDYFRSRDPMISRLSCMDASRQTFYMIVTSEEKPDVELASEVNVTSTPQKTHTQRPPSVVSSVRSVRKSSAVIREEQEAEPEQRTDEYDSYDVYPHDSASNVDHAIDAAEEEYVLPSPPGVTREHSTVSREGSTVSRHDAVFDPPPTRPRSNVSSVLHQPTHQSRTTKIFRASSPESSVSVGMHHAHSPKR